jgi:hypothetical protein
MKQYVYRYRIYGREDWSALQYIDATDEMKAYRMIRRKIGHYQFELRIQDMADALQLIR